MILSVSRRTDIPAFYSEWFFNRIKHGFVYVRNPINRSRVSDVPLNPDVIDAIVFWTKNPQPMLERLHELREYLYYFQFSVNPYPTSLEVSVPRKNKILDTFARLSDTIGPHRVVWRYDPIIMSDSIDVNYHVAYFEKIASRLSPYTERCMVSFLRNYRKTERNLKSTSTREPVDDERYQILEKINPVAKAHGIKLQTCSISTDYSVLGVEKGKCIDNKLVERIIGRQIRSWKDHNQREACGCIESVDIGEYNTCLHNCLYCYANLNQKVVRNNRVQHNPQAPLLVGTIGKNDVLSKRNVTSLIEKRLF